MSDQLDHSRLGCIGEQSSRPFLLPDERATRQLAIEVSKGDRLSAGVNLVLRST